MQLDDIIYAIQNANRQARSPLVSIRENPYESGVLAAGGADITLTLPKPSQGFVRRWESLAIITSVVAAADQLFFTRVASDFTTGTPLWYVTGYATGVPFSFPVISGIANFVNANIIGIQPFFVAPEDNLVVFVDFNAPVAQTVNVRGWYKDLPI